MPPKKMSTDAAIKAFDNEDIQPRIKDLINAEEMVKTLCVKRLNRQLMHLSLLPFSPQWVQLYSH